MCRNAFSIAWAGKVDGSKTIVIDRTSNGEFMVDFATPQGVRRYSHAEVAEHARRIREAHRKAGENGQDNAPATQGMPWAVQAAENFAALAPQGNWHRLRISIA